MNEMCQQKNLLIGFQNWTALRKNKNVKILLLPSRLCLNGKIFRFKKSYFLKKSLKKKIEKK